MGNKGSKLDDSKSLADNQRLEEAERNSLLNGTWKLQAMFVVPPSTPAHFREVDDHAFYDAEYFQLEELDAWNAWVDGGVKHKRGRGSGMPPPHRKRGAELTHKGSMDADGVFTDSLGRSYPFGMSHELQGNIHYDGRGKVMSATILSNSKQVPKDRSKPKMSAQIGTTYAPGAPVNSYESCTTLPVVTYYTGPFWFKHDESEASDHTLVRKSIKKDSGSTATDRVSIDVEYQKSYNDGYTLVEEGCVVHKPTMSVNPAYVNQQLPRQYKIYSHKSGDMLQLVLKGPLGMDNSKTGVIVWARESPQGLLKQRKALEAQHKEGWDQKQSLLRYQQSLRYPEKDELEINFMLREVFPFELTHTIFCFLVQQPPIPFFGYHDTLEWAGIKHDGYFPCPTFRGARHGLTFKLGDLGLGYYKDTPPIPPAATATASADKKMKHVDPNPK